jgi:hypothetical protein
LRVPAASYATSIPLRQIISIINSEKIYDPAWRAGCRPDEKAAAGRPQRIQHWMETALSVARWRIAIAGTTNENPHFSVCGLPSDYGKNT